MNDMSASEMNSAMISMTQRREDRVGALIPSVTIQASEVGTAAISHFTLKAADLGLTNLGLLFDGQVHRTLLPGEYTRLVANGKLQMTDTTAEKADHYTAVLQAKGDCLVTGLGLGMVANAMAQKPEVDTVTVIEINADVIELVKASLHEKIKVIHADALEWVAPRGYKWDVIWHDIWPDICLTDCESRRKLSNRFSKKWRLYHGAWAKDEIRKLQRGSY